MSKLHSQTDRMWESIRADTMKDVEKEPLLASFFHAAILNHKSLENALGFILANKLASPVLQSILLMELFCSAFEKDPKMGISVCADLSAVKERDPACKGYMTPLLYFKGFHALQSYRIAHWLWSHKRRSLALAIQNRVSEVFAVDIHPAAKIGNGILIDHATGLVIGETAVIKDNVSILHQVTLGGTGKEKGDRHPKIGEGVLISANATILGNVIIGDGAKIGAGSVVLTNIPPHCTAVGVPAKVCGHPKAPSPALEMNHQVSNDSQGGD